MYWVYVVVSVRKGSQTPPSRSNHQEIIWISDEFQGDLWIQRMVIQPLIGILISWVYFHPYYWVDFSHPRKNMEMSWELIATFSSYATCQRWSLLASLQDDRLMFDPLSFNDFPAIMASETKEVPMGKRWDFLAEDAGSWKSMKSWNLQKSNRNL